MIMQGDYTESDDIMIKRIFQRHILRLIYNSLIHPHLLSGLYIEFIELNKQKKI